MSRISDRFSAQEFQKNSILIVDDNPRNLGMLSDYLRDYGFKIFVATDGELACKRARYARPDLILLDVVMPGIDGFETCRRLKAEAETRDIPVVFMTALAANAEDKVRGFEVGAIDYITKPFYREEILARVMTHLHIENLTRSLQTANDELSQTLEDLKYTQEQLFESEKMAALGRLVAGIAHEINTPIGIGITASSALENDTKALIESYETDHMTRSAFQKHLSTTLQSSQIILRNLLRVADLVRSFKQVAVDQMSPESQLFPVKPYLENILLSLMPHINRAHHTLTVNGDESIMLQGYPGVLSQIVTNLVMNSVMHAYQNNGHGHLCFDLMQKHDRIILTYSDNGCGIAPEHQSKIFDPFFTTARNQGGTGLGLYIVYNLVTQKLKGTIQCVSQPGSGTTFTLELPCQ